MTQKTKQAQKKEKADSYRGWRLRLINPPGENRRPLWQADNGNRNDRKRFSSVERKAVLDSVDRWIEEREKHGTEHSLDADVREAALRAVRVSGGRATLDEIVKYWAERHPTDGNKVGLGEMVDQFITARKKQGNRPATIREIRQKLTAFKNAVGPETAVAGIWEDDIERFMAGTGGGDVSRRAWKKVLVSFFRWCAEKPREAIKSNPAVSIVVPEAKGKKVPPTWAARDVESFMRIVEREEPEYAAAFAVLWFAGIRPTELVGQYDLEHEKVKEAKTKLKQARTNYGAERLRLGLGQGRGGNARKKAEAQARLDASPEAAELKKAQEHLAKMQEKHGGGVMPHLQWSDICFDPKDKFITIRKDYSKVGEQRHVEILPNLEIWLRKYRRIGGALVPNPIAFRRARARILEKMERVEWKADICRHCFASYFYKAYHDRDRLADMMGHTAMSKQIEKHYKNPCVKNADAEKYWKIVPEGETMPGTVKRKARKGA
jgi:integrase